MQLGGIRVSVSLSSFIVTHVCYAFHYKQNPIPDEFDWSLISGKLLWSVSELCRSKGTNYNLNVALLDME